MEANFGGQFPYGGQFLEVIVLVKAISWDVGGGFLKMEAYSRGGFRY
jgi:hypothetical protein